MAKKKGSSGDKKRVKRESTSGSFSKDAPKGGHKERRSANSMGVLIQDPDVRPKGTTVKIIRDAVEHVYKKR